MKIALILSSNLIWAPYYYKYEDFLVKNNCQFDLLIWNREGKEELSKGNMIEFNCPDKTNDGNWKKIFSFFKFAKFLKRKLKEKKYDKIVFLGTYAFIPASISLFLKRKYKNKYWIDIRDLTYESNKLFYMFENKAINNAKNVTISSKGFEKYLPKYNYNYIHNIDSNINEISTLYKKTDSEKIRISYIGNIGFLNEVIKFLNVFKNNDDYILQFFGNGSEKVEQYCKENNIYNVSFKGKFKKEETIDFYNSTDIVYNLYGNNNKNVRSALSNKFYYALKFNLPILVSPNTYMEEISKECKIGVAFEENHQFPSYLKKWYLDFVENNESNNESVWNYIANQDMETWNKFMEFLNEK